METEKQEYNRKYWEKEAERANKASEETNDGRYADAFNERHYRFLWDNGYVSKPVQIGLSFWRQ